MGIKKKLDARLVGIEDAPDPIAFVTYQMFWVMREFFALELRTAPGIWDYATELTVLGGIQINRAKGGDRFMPSCFRHARSPRSPPSTCSTRRLDPSTIWVRTSAKNTTSEQTNGAAVLAENLDNFACRWLRAPQSEPAAWQHG